MASISPPLTLNALERKAVSLLGAIYALRMLGLFIILPVFAIYAEDLDGSTPLLAGLAVGIYGLTQAVFQIPMGWLSDRFGRRGVVVLGLLVFVVGSLLAADADNIGQMIVGRALQGAGAISAALAAWVADLSRDEVRAKVMGLIGMLIGMTFILSLIAGPLLESQIGTDGIFVLVAALGGLALIKVLFWVPRAPHRKLSHASSWSDVRKVLADPRLLRLDLGVALIHMVLTANFMSLPLALRDLAGLPLVDHSLFYLVVLGGSALFLFPILRMAHHRVRGWLVASALLLVVCELLLIGARHDTLLMGGVLLLFFVGFNFLEAQLPSQVSRLCPAHLKGTALGVFSTAQFLGAFLGGLLTGIFTQIGQEVWLYAFLAATLVLWIPFLNRLQLDRSRTTETVTKPGETA